MHINPKKFKFSKQTKLDLANEKKKTIEELVNVLQNERDTERHAFIVAERKRLIPFEQGDLISAAPLNGDGPIIIGVFHSAIPQRYNELNTDVLLDAKKSSAPYRYSLDAEKYEFKAVGVIAPTKSNKKIVLEFAGESYEMTPVTKKGK